MRKTERPIAAASTFVRRKKTTRSDQETITMSPRTKVGSASASDGHMRVEISYPMSRPLSLLPKSSARSGTLFSKKIVSVSFSAPSFSPLKKRGLSSPRAAFQD